MTEPLPIDPNSDFVSAATAQRILESTGTVAVVHRPSPFAALLELETHLDALERVAVTLCKASILPKDMQAPANLKLVLLQGLAMGFDPIQAIRASYIITSSSQPPRVGYYVEALVALVRRSDVCRFFRVEEASSEKCRVVCGRKDEDESMLHVFEFTIEQARKANLDKKWEKDGAGNWRAEEKYTWKASPADMLRNRVCGRAVKSVFQDVVYGMATPDEVDDAQEAAESTTASDRYVAAPIARQASAPPASSRPVTPAPQEAELVYDGSGDAAWDEMLAELHVKSGAIATGWLPDDVLEQFGRRIDAARTRGELNALGYWVASASARAARSKVCADVASKLREQFNARAAVLKTAAAATPKEGAAS